MGAGRVNRLNLREDGLGGRLARMLTRRAMLRGGTVTAGAAVLAGFGQYRGLLRAAAQMRPEVQAIIDAAATLEAMVVTYISAWSGTGHRQRLGCSAWATTPGRCATSDPRSARRKPTTTSWRRKAPCPRLRD